MKALKILILLIFLKATYLHAQKNSDTTQSITYVTGKINDGIKHDTLYLLLHGQLYNEAPEKGATQILTANANQRGEFKFKIITTNHPFHMSLFLSSERDIQFGNLLGKVGFSNYLIEPGDSIYIDFYKDKQLYSGNGAELFKAQYILQQTDKDDYMLRSGSKIDFNVHPEQWINEKDSILNVKLDVLSIFKTKISPVAYSVVRADVIGTNRAFVYRRIGFADSFFGSKEAQHQALHKVIKDLEQSAAYINQDDPASLSPKYVDYLYKKLVIETKFERAIRNGSYSLDLNYFPAINRAYKGILRDKLLTCWLNDMASFGVLRPEFIEEVLKVMQTGVYIKMVDSLRATYAKGQPVTDFEFRNADGQPVKLTDFNGKVLFLDIWFTGCTPCLAVAKGLPDVEKAFKDRNDIDFISLSIDKDQQKWLQSIDKKLSDKEYSYYTTPSTIYLYTGGTGTNNPFIKKYVPNGLYPSLFIIDKQGKLFSSTPSRPVNEEGKKELIAQLNQALNDIKSEASL